MNKGNTAIAIVLIIVGVLIAGTGVWYFKYREKPLAQQQPVEQNQPTAAPKDEFADWKTYRNEKYGFEFKYPQELPVKNRGFKRLAIETDDFVGVVKAIQGYSKLDFDEFGVFSVEVQSAPESFDSYIKSQPDYVMDECYHNAKYFKDEPINIIIDKIKGFSPTSFCLFIQKNNYLYKFGIGVYGSKEDNDLFFKILSTFKFLK